LDFALFGVNTNVRKTIDQVTTASFALPALIAVLNLIPAGRVTAQTFTTLHSFTASSTNSSGVYTNSDGANPSAGLITNSSGNTLYGTASHGGSSGNGTVFAMNTDGSGFTILHCFGAGTGSPVSSITNSDGAYPFAGLVLSGNTLYGTTILGGSSGNGAVIAVNTDGTGFTNLHSFTAVDRTYLTNSEGANLYAGLVLSGNTLYGTARSGGSSGKGTVFALNTNGTDFTNLHNFTDSDTGNPYAGLVLAGNTLYGTTYFFGGSMGSGGTVFALNTNGMGFTNLHNFAAYYDGSSITAGLVLAGNTLYGTASQGGSWGVGTVFAVNTDGMGYTTLHIFVPLGGSHPIGGLILSGNTLYGTAYQGGSSDNGTVFAVNTEGTGFTNLHSFAGPSFDNLYRFPVTNSDGALPYAGLILSGSTLYGTASGGGSSGNGTVFSLSFRPQLTITPSGTNVILSWPTNVAGFDYTGYTLQSTTNPVSSAVWSTNSPAPVVIAGQNTVTNPITGAQQFYRLVQ
jgi:uncharacterized repeat protein (TIGR03803 family)